MYNYITKLLNQLCSCIELFYHQKKYYTGRYVTRKTWMHFVAVYSIPLVTQSTRFVYPVAYYQYIIQESNKKCTIYPIILNMFTIILFIKYLNRKNVTIYVQKGRIRSGYIFFTCNNVMQYQICPLFMNNIFLLYSYFKSSTVIQSFLQKLLIYDGVISTIDHFEQDRH